MLHLYSVYQVGECPPHIPPIYVCDDIGSPFVSELEVYADISTSTHRRSPCGKYCVIYIPGRSSIVQWPGLLVFLSGLR